MSIRHLAWFLYNIYMSLDTFPTNNPENREFAAENTAEAILANSRIGRLKLSTEISELLHPLGLTLQTPEPIAQKGVEILTQNLKGNNSKGIATLEHDEALDLRDAFVALRDQLETEQSQFDNEAEQTQFREAVNLLKQA